MSVNHFSKQVAASLSAIERFGFDVNETSNDRLFLISRNALVRINVSYDSGFTHEVLIEISLLGHQSGVFNLGEVFREFKINEPHCWQTSDCNSAVAFVIRSLQHLVEAVSPVLQGDAATFSRLAARRTKESNEYTLKMNISCVRERADQAWKSHDYGKFQQLLEPYEEGLSEVDQRKLRFARSRQN